MSTRGNEVQEEVRRVALRLKRGFTKGVLACDADGVEVNPWTSRATCWGLAGACIAERVSNECTWLLEDVMLAERRGRWLSDLDCDPAFTLPEMTRLLRAAFRRAG